MLMKCLPVFYKDGIVSNSNVIRLGFRLVLIIIVSYKSIPSCVSFVMGHKFFSNTHSDFATFFSGQEDNSAVISSDKQPATVTKKRRTNLLQDSVRMVF